VFLISPRRKEGTAQYIIVKSCTCIVKCENHHAHTSIYIEDNENFSLCKVSGATEKIEENKP